MTSVRREPCPFDGCNVLSKLLFCWLNPLCGRSAENVFENSKQYDLPSADEADLLEKQLSRFWKKQVDKYCKGGRASLKTAVLSAFIWQCMLPGFLLFLSEFCRLLQPVLAGCIIVLLVEGTVQGINAYALGFGLCMLLLLHMCFGTMYMFMVHHTALRMKSALEALVFHKIILLSCEATGMASSSCIATYFSSRDKTLCRALEDVHYLWVGGLQTGIAAFLLYRQLGLSGLLCLSVVFAVLVSQIVQAVASSKMRRIVSLHSKGRWQLLNRVLAVIVQVKMSCTEPRYISQLSKLRRQEVCQVRWYILLQSFVCSVPVVLCRLLLPLVVSVAIDAETATSLWSVLTSVTLLDTLTWCLFRFPVPVVTNWLGMLKFLAVVQEFLLLDEEKEQITDLRLQRSVSFLNELYSDWAISIEHMTARWRSVHYEKPKKFRKGRVRDSTSSARSLLHESSDAEHSFSLKYLSLHVKKGELIVITGKPLSGKTSLLLTLIGELPYEIGQISVNGNISFCSQTPWIFSTSVRHNILFGNSFSPARYDTVIDACLLVEELDRLPNGDSTVIGKLGVKLSLTCMAKITLARTVYQLADVYLIDDIFSCFDRETTADFLKRGVCGILESKTRILISHNSHLLKSADRIMVLKKGSTLDTGSYKELQSRGVNLKDFVYTGLQKREALRRLGCEEERERLRLMVPIPHSEEDEELNTFFKQTDWDVLLSFLTPRCFCCLLFFFILFCSAAQAMMFISDWSLTNWLHEKVKHVEDFLYTSQADVTSPASRFILTANTTGYVSRTFSDQQMLLYTVFLAVSVSACFIFTMLLSQILTSATDACHSRMLSALMRVKVDVLMNWSSDNIISKFSEHLSILDVEMPPMAISSLHATLHIFGFMVVTCFINFWLIFAAIPFAGIFVIAMFYGFCTWNGLFMLTESAVRPVKVDFDEALAGLMTIRASKQQASFLQRFYSHIDVVTWSSFLQLSVTCRLLLVAVVVWVGFIAVVVVSSIYTSDDVNTALSILSIAYCGTVLMPLRVLIRLSSRFGDIMASMRHVVSIQNLEQELPWHSDKPPPPDWPNRGSITFSKVCFSPLANGSRVLREIDMHIKSKEKVGVVGDAMSGKNCLLAALLRLWNLQGMLFIDGFDVLKIGLHELRKNVAVVSKDPVMLPGSLRLNIDKTGERGDDQIWHALEQVGLKERVSGIRGGLSSAADDVALLLDRTQLRLLILASALLDRTRILIFEEDVRDTEYELSQDIHQTLRARFCHYTVFTIAHHLSTVMDCDRIAVFHEGEVKEFDTPYNLMQRGSSGFMVRLAQGLGQRKMKQLYAMAELSHHRRASASLMLQHSVYMATEQLQASTEDLTFHPGQLAWSHVTRFHQSSDSLEKATGDSRNADPDMGGDALIRDSLKSGRVCFAPAQKLINKRRATGSNQNSHHRFGRVDGDPGYSHPLQYLPTSAECIGDPAHGQQMTKVNGNGNPSGSDDMCLTEVESVSSPLLVEQYAVGASHEDASDEHQVESVSHDLIFGEFSPPGKDGIGDPNRIIYC